MRLDKLLLLCCSLAFAGCFSYPEPTLPPPPFPPDQVRAAAADMKNGILTHPHVAGTIGELHIRFAGVANDTRFEDNQVDLLGRLLVRELAEGSAGRLTFVGAETESAVDDIDYLLSGEVKGAPRAGPGGIVDFFLVTMKLEDPVSHRIAWQKSYEFTVARRNGIAYR